MQANACFADPLLLQLADFPLIGMSVLQFALTLACAALLALFFYRIVRR